MCIFLTCKLFIIHIFPLIFHSRLSSSSPNASPVVLIEGQVVQQRPCPASKSCSRVKAAVGQWAILVISRQRNVEMIYPLAPLGSVSPRPAGMHQYTAVPPTPSNWVADCLLRSCRKNWMCTTTAQINYPSICGFHLSSADKLAHCPEIWACC